jgi:hypothetical protein
MYELTDVFISASLVQICRQEQIDELKKFVLFSSGCMSTKFSDTKQIDETGSLRAICIAQEKSPAMHLAEDKTNPSDVRT